MFERMMIEGAAIAERRARSRRRRIAEAARAAAPPGVGVEEEREAVALSGRGLSRRFALEPALRWLVAGLGR
jgi:hypothetical protein